MGGLILTVLTGFHLLSSVIWVGGIIFILFIAIPSSRQVMGADAAKMTGEMSKRFTPYANYSILLLVVTGTLLGFSKGYFSSPLSTNQSILYLKSLLALGMIGIHFYRGLILSPRIVKTEPQTEKSALRKLSLNLVKLNLLLGVIIFLLAGYISIK